MKFINYLQLCILFLVSNLTFLSAQTEQLSVFIQCNCDKNYLRQKLSYVNHVRDQGLADVQLFIYDIGNGSGGKTYTLTFTGQNAYKEINQEITYVRTPNMTNDQVRKGLLKKTALGLLNYLLQSNQADQIDFSISNNQSHGQAKTDLGDPWNNWIFEIYGQGELEKETSKSAFDLEFGFRGDRVTENWRLRLDAELNYSKSRFKGREKEILRIRQKNFANSSIVRSLNGHWSAGIFGGVELSTYNNIGLSYWLTPAIEYSLFPYEEVLNREIVIAYKLGYTHNDYIEQTIFGKVNEYLLNQSLDIMVRFRQPWGDLSTQLRTSTYLHDLSKNRIELNSRVSIRVYKGLAVKFFANLDLIRDQLNIPAGDASLEDILLQQRQISTDFEVRTGIGISYTFGSAFNNIVNTRL